MDKRYEDLRKLQEQVDEARRTLKEAQNNPEYEPADMIWLYLDVLELEAKLISARAKYIMENELCAEDEDHDEEYIWDKRAQDEFWREMDNDPWDDEPRSDAVDEEE